MKVYYLLFRNVLQKPFIFSRILKHKWPPILQRPCWPLYHANRWDQVRLTYCLIRISLNRLIVFFCQIWDFDCQLSVHFHLFVSLLRTIHVVVFISTCVATRALDYSSLIKFPSGQVSCPLPVLVNLSVWGKWHYSGLIPSPLHWAMPVYLSRAAEWRGCDLTLLSK